MSFRGTWWIVTTNNHMKKKAALICLSLSLVWMIQPAAAGTIKEPGDALVSVVSLDKHGDPWRQGMGILVGKDGTILTSASLLANCRAGIVKTADGALYPIRQITYLNHFQDLALLQIEPGDSKLAGVKTAPRFQPPEKVWVGVRKKAGVQLMEAQLTKAFPFSPRLALLKLEPTNLAAEPGSPVLNRRGELVGMLHSFAGSPDRSQTYRFFLARTRDHLALADEGSKEKWGCPEKPVKGFNAPELRDFWEGVGFSMRREWRKAQEKFTEAIADPAGPPEAYYGRGVTRYHLGDWAGAVQDLKEATQRLSGYALAFLWLGKARERQGNRAGAKQDYEQAVALLPDLGDAWFCLGELAYKEGNLGRAKECLERAKGDSAQVAQSCWYLGNIAIAENRPQQALNDFTLAVKSDPGFFEAYLDGGKLLVEDLGQAEKGAAWLRQAVRLQPGRTLARYYLALAYALSWNYAAAWEQYFILQNENPQMANLLAITLDRSK